MTHKEEAINRVNEFKPFTDSISVINYSTDNKWHLRNCKQCALLAIDREVRIIERLASKQSHYKTLEWLTKVKQEIEQL